jgi:hypothetical protein
VEFVGAFLLSQTFRLQILRPLRLLISFQEQRANNRFQRCTILRKVFQLRVHRCAYYSRNRCEFLRAIFFLYFLR